MVIKIHMCKLIQNIIKWLEKREFHRLNSVLNHVSVLNYDFDYHLVLNDIEHYFCKSAFGNMVLKSGLGHSGRLIILEVD